MLENQIEEVKETQRVPPIFNPKETIQNDSFEERPAFITFTPKAVDPMEDDEASQ